MQQYQDKDLVCAECGETFVFSAQEQQLFAERGYRNEPKRCPSCREARRSRNNRDDFRSERQMYPAVCADCGKETMVPFEPRQGRPVYCQDCYRNRRPSRW